MEKQVENWERKRELGRGKGKERKGEQGREKITEKRKGKKRGK